MQIYLFPILRSAVTKALSEYWKRNGAGGTHPKVVGPSGTAASTTQFRSTSASSAYERHDCIHPILVILSTDLKDVGIWDLLRGQSSPGILQAGQQPS